MSHFGNRGYNRRHCAAAYRSGLERKVAAQFEEAGINVRYEELVIPYIQPAKNRRYTPDFLLPNGIIIETKGLFTTDDRKKMEWVREQFPDIDIRFVFTNPRSKLYKGSKTTYADWCDKQGYLWAKQLVPEPWLTAPDNAVSLSAIQRLTT